MWIKAAHPLTPVGKLVRWAGLLLGASPVVGAYFYARGLHIPFLVCPLRYWTGVPCPTCGMTRSFTALVQGDWEQAIAYHLFGPALFLAFLVLTLHCCLELGKGRRLKAFYEAWVRKLSLQVAAGCLVGGYYLLRLGLLAHSGELGLAMVRSPLGQWLLLWTASS